MGLARSLNCRVIVDDMETMMEAETESTMETMDQQDAIDGGARGHRARLP